MTCWDLDARTESCKTTGTIETNRGLLVSIVPIFQDSVRVSGSQQVISHLPDLWRATRIRPGSNPFVLYTVDLLRVIDLRNVTAHVRRRHARVRILSAVRGYSTHSEHH